MSGISESPVGRWDQVAPDRCTTKGQRERNVWRTVAATILSLAFVEQSPDSQAFAQAPGPESFAQEPKSPIELWSAIDYLVRTGQSKKAVPYLDRFIKSKPNDESLMQIRDQFGIGSILRLADDPATTTFTKPASELMTQAGSTVRDPAPANCTGPGWTDPDSGRTRCRRSPPQGGRPVRRARAGRGPGAAHDLS